MDGQNTNRRTVNFFKQYIPFLHLLALVPNYDFETRKVIKTRWQTVTIVLRIIVFVSLHVVLIRRRHLTYILYAETQPQFPQKKIHVAIIVVCDFLGFSIVNSFLKTTVCKSAEWSQAFNLMLELESSPRLRCTEIPQEKYLRSGLVQNRCAHLLIWIYIIGAIISTRFYEQHFDALAHFTSYYYFYVSILILGLQVNLILSIKLKYQAVRDCLENSSGTQTTAFLNEIKSMYISISRIVKSLNIIFGTNNELVFLYSGFGMLRTYFEAYFFLLPEYNGEKDLPYTFTELVLITAIVCLLTCLILCGILLATFCCDLAVKESQKIATACRRRMLQYPPDSQEYLEFENLADHVTKIKPKFTAAGCWEINRSTVFSLITGCGTYFIILIQYFKDW